MAVTEEDPQLVMMQATCHTPGCPAEGIPSIAPYYPNPEPPTYRGWCAQCDQPITDIVPPPGDTAA